MRSSLTSSREPVVLPGVSEWLPLDAELSPAAEVDVFAFPHAGASAEVLRLVSRKLPPWLCLRPLELPGRGRRMGEDPRWRVEPLVTEIAAVLGRHLLRPSVFFGHSMGALLAFETARRLRALGLPKYLVVSGHKGPQLDRSDLRGHEDDDDTFAAELRRWGGDEAGWLEDENLRSLFLPVLREDFRALVAYRYLRGPPLACPITAIRGESDPYVDETSLASWAELTSAPFESLTIRGGHFYFLSQPDPLVAALEAVGTRLRPVHGG